MRCGSRRVLELWEVGHFERYLKQFVRDELPQCSLQQSTQAAMKKINNKTARFARASQEVAAHVNVLGTRLKAWMVHLKEPKSMATLPASPGQTAPWSLSFWSLKRLRRASTLTTGVCRLGKVPLEDLRLPDANVKGL